MTSPISVWEFRANFEDQNVEGLKNTMKSIAKKWCFQHEKGDGGYEHWQGRFSLMKKRRKTELMKLLEGMDIPIFNYLEPTISAESQKTAFYVMKQDTRIEGPWTDEQKEVYIPRQYREIELWPWQQSILDSADKFDFRGVDCIVDRNGNIGKTTVASIAELYGKGIDMPPINDHEKLIASLCDILMAKSERTPGIVFVDLPRAFDKRNLASYYVAIEQIKKGKVYDLRYSYKEWWFDSPRVWVFTNVDPDTELLSRDRWRFWTVEKTEKTLSPYEPEERES